MLNCMYICNLYTSVHVDMCTRRSKCVYVGRPEMDPECLSQTFFTFFFRTGSYWAWCQLFCLAGYQRALRIQLSLLPLALGLGNTANLAFFYMSAGNKSLGPHAPVIRGLLSELSSQAVMPSLSSEFIAIHNIYILIIFMFSVTYRKCFLAYNFGLILF